MVEEEELHFKINTTQMDEMVVAEAVLVQEQPNTGHHLVVKEVMVY